MFSIDQQQPTTSSSSSHINICATNCHQFNNENILKLFCCISDNDNKNNNELDTCCRYLNGTSDLFNDELNSTTCSTVEASSDSNVTSSGETSIPRTSKTGIKRRKNSKTNINLTNTDKKKQDGGDSKLESKQSNQFDDIMNSLSHNLSMLAENYGKNYLETLPITNNNNAAQDDDIHHSNFVKDWSFVSLLQQIYHDFLQIKRCLTIKSSTANRRKSLNSVEIVPKSNTIASYNSNIEMLLQNKMLILQLLHFECIILPLLGPLLSSETAAAIFASNMAPFKLQDIFRTYYILLNKLSYESSFLKTITFVHRKTMTNTANILLLMFRSLASYCTLKEEDDATGTATAVDSSIEIDDDVDEAEDEETNNSCVDHKVSNLKYSISIANNKMINSMMIFLQSLAVNYIFATQTKKSSNATGQKRVSHNKLQFIKLKPISLAYVCHDIMSHFSQEQGSSKRLRNKTTLYKSTIRTYAIESMAHLCLTTHGLNDTISIGSVLLRTILSLLSKCIASHTKIIIEDKQILRHSSSGLKLNLDDKKNYTSILRDIYGLLSILISLSDCKSGREYLLFHNIPENLLNTFMMPLVETLNGTETLDPKQFLKGDQEVNRVNNPSDAYKTLRAYLVNNQKIQQYLDRIMNMASIVVQRLLNPLVLPIANCHNPFNFDIPINDANQMERTDDQDDDFVDNVEIFNKDFDSDLEDEEDNDDIDEDETDDNDSIVQNEHSGYVGENSIQSPNIVSEESFEENSNHHLIESYLRYFPEIRHFNWKSSNENGNKNDNILSCQCDFQIKNIISRNEKSGIVDTNCLDNLLTRKMNPKVSWSNIYRNEYRTTKSVLPRESLPEPELNFVNEVSLRNESLQPMTYPFLNCIVRRKNFHHIKLVDHIKERLSSTDKPTYKVIYDVENTGSDDINNGDYLKFDSRFECGNLRKVVICQSKWENKTDEEEDEYLLILNSDINSASHTQWFYFNVRGMKYNRRYRFKIINCEKKSILYNSGQQPLFYSCRQFDESGKMWQRCGNVSTSQQQQSNSNIVAYYRNHYVRHNSLACLFTDKPLYTLEYTFNFPHEDDVCYFAYNIPYSYSMLKTNIVNWTRQIGAQQINVEEGGDVYGSSGSKSSIYFSTQTLCTTLRGNDLPVITITSNCHSSQSKQTKPHYVFISARVHPAETNSSWIMKGFIDFLLGFTSLNHSDQQLRQKLLQNYIFKIIPMLNPDGVINGCTRTDLQSNDLNRQWHSPSALLHPTIYHSKMLLKCLQKFSSGCNPVAFIDLHGHSRSKNIFSYSCSPLLSWKSSDRKQYHKQASLNHFCLCPTKHHSSCKLKHQLNLLKTLLPDENNQLQFNHQYSLMPSFVTIPVLLHLQQAPAFQLENCSFMVQKDREHTGRVVCWREFNIALSYTVECSASGCDFGPYAGYHLSIDQMEEMGKFISSSFAYLDFIYCSSRHVPIIVMPKNQNSLSLESSSPIRHPGNNVFLKNLLDKCTKRRKNGPQTHRVVQKLLQMYPDLNMLSAASVSTSSSSSLSSSITSLSSNLNSMQSSLSKNN